MTDNVEQIRDMMYARERTNNQDNTCNSNMENNNIETQENYEILKRIKKGDHVIRISDGKKLLVDNVDEHDVLCYISFLKGYEHYSPSEIEIEKGK